jgi:hypothetical protein
MTYIIDPSTLIQSKVSTVQILSIARHVLHAKPNFVENVMNLMVSSNNSSNAFDTVKDLKMCFIYRENFFSTVHGLPKSCKQLKMLQTIFSTSKKEDISNILNPVASDEALTFTDSTNFDEILVNAINCASLLICSVILCTESDTFQIEGVFFDKEFNLINTPMTSPTLENEARLNSLESSVFEMQSNIKSMMNSMESMVKALANKSVTSTDSLDNSRKEPKKPVPHTKKDAGNPYSILNKAKYRIDNEVDSDDESIDDPINDDIEEYSEDNLDQKSNFDASYTLSERTFLEMQFSIWKSNVKPISEPRKINALISLMQSHGMLIAQASGQLIQIKFLKSSMKSNCSYETLSLGTSFIDCQTNILVPRSFPEYIKYNQETTECLQNMVCEVIDCNEEMKAWATAILVYFPKFSNSMELKFKHIYNKKFCITQFAILWRLHIWILNVTIISKDVTFLNKLDEIWDKHIKTLFDTDPLKENLLTACNFLGYRCVSCNNKGLPYQLCPTITCLKDHTTSAKPSYSNVKTPLTDDYKTWLLLPETTTLIASKPKNFNKFDHYYSNVATKAQKDQHTKIKSGTGPFSRINSSNFSNSTNLDHYLNNQHEILLNGPFEHFSK